MSYLSIHFAGEIWYDAKTEEWIKLASNFMNEKNSLPIFSLLLDKSFDQIKVFSYIDTFFDCSVLKKEITILLLNYCNLLDENYMYQHGTGCWSL